MNNKLFFGVVAVIGYLLWKNKQVEAAIDNSNNVPINTDNGVSMPNPNINTWPINGDGWVKYNVTRVVAPEPGKQFEKLKLDSKTRNFIQQDWIIPSIWDNIMLGIMPKVVGSSRYNFESTYTLDKLKELFPGLSFSYYNAQDSTNLPAKQLIEKDGKFYCPYSGEELIKTTSSSPGMWVQVLSTKIVSCPNGHGAISVMVGNPGTIVTLNTAMK